jgi:hypothetical protein
MVQVVGKLKTASIWNWSDRPQSAVLLGCAGDAAPAITTPLHDPGRVGPSVACSSAITEGAQHRACGPCQSLELSPGVSEPARRRPTRLAFGEAATRRSGRSPVDEYER